MRPLCYALAALVLALLTPAAKAASSQGCQAASSEVRAGNFTQALVGLDQCVDADVLAIEERARYRQLKSWSLYKLGRYSEATRELERSFELVSARTNSQFINYALLLRAERRFSESLRAVERAEARDREEGSVNMQTQYHKGWTLQEAGRHREAVAAFSAGIPDQPDFPHVFRLRSLSLFELGKRAEARSDMETFFKLFSEEWKRSAAAQEIELYRSQAKRLGLKPPME